MYPRIKRIFYYNEIGKHPYEDRASFDLISRKWYLSEILAEPLLFFNREDVTYSLFAIFAF